VVDHENTSALRIKSWRPPHHYFRAGKIGNPAAKASLQPVVLSRIEHDGKSNQNGHENQEVEPADEP
jgi:hypothetical protein